MTTCSPSSIPTASVSALAPVRPVLTLARAPRRELTDVVDPVAASSDIGGSRVEAEPPDVARTPRPRHAPRRQTGAGERWVEVRTRSPLGCTTGDRARPRRAGPRVTTTRSPPAPPGGRRRGSSPGSTMPLIGVQSPLSDRCTSSSSSSPRRTTAVDPTATARACPTCRRRSSTNSGIGTAPDRVTAAGAPRPGSPGGSRPTRRCRGPGPAGRRRAARASSPRRPPRPRAGWPAPAGGR